ncbi:MAG TPA: class I SAM-dependent methyltransferase [Candidatus Methylomirabilis sp.]|nr:class I SAM-dependent methyltransferase [Candidatus Methylomirabilis sp.]
MVCQLRELAQRSGDPVRSAPTPSRKTARATGTRKSQGRETLRDYGRAIPREVWDRQYRQGAWESLDSIHESGHYMVIAGYIHHLFVSPTVLDVGCGPGRLGGLVKALACKSYLGIDLSPEAIKQARRRTTTHARFRVADLNQWNPSGRFSAIVFCESLNYAARPASTLVRYARALEPEGVLIVSLCRHRNHGRIWKNVAREFTILDVTTVTNRKQQTWDIKVLRPRPNGGTGSRRDTSRESG